MESELFGHTKGAFTGADTSQPGMFVTAQGGTVFLDEIGDLAPKMQAKLLRTLQEGTIRPPGSARERKVDVWMLAATNRDVIAMMNTKEFRDDLFYRFVIKLYTPKLADRKEDIPELAEYIWGKTCKKKKSSLSDELMDSLKAMPWPGNVREIKSVLKTMVTFSPKQKIYNKKHLDQTIEYMYQGMKLIDKEEAKEDVSMHRNKCLRHLKRTHNSINDVLYESRRLLDEGPLAARDYASALSRIESQYCMMVELGRQQLLFYSHDTCSSFNKFHKIKFKKYLKEWCRGVTQAKEYWDNVMKDALKEIRDIVYKEIENMLRH